MKSRAGYFWISAVWVASMVAVFAIAATPSIRVFVAAELLSLIPPAASRVHLAHRSVAEILQLVEHLPRLRQSTQLLMMEAFWAGSLFFVALYGPIREWAWTSGGGGIRRIGRRPHLVSANPENPSVYALRIAMMAAAVAAVLIWKLQLKLRANVNLSDFNVADWAVAAFRVPEEQGWWVLACITACALAWLGFVFRESISDQLARMVRRRRLTIANVPIPTHLETSHFLLVGSTGSGKTELALQIARAVARRNEQAIFVDYGANYYSRMGSPQDVILNPFDPRSVCWSPWREIRSQSDYMMLAHAIIPSAYGDAKSWHGYAQQLVAAALRACVENGRSTIKEFLDLLIATPEEMAVLAAGTPASVMTQKGNEKMFANTRNVLMEYLEPWRYLREPKEGEATFSIREFIEGRRRVDGTTDGARQPWLFITFRDDQRAAMQYLAATWMELVIRAQLSLPDDGDRRIWKFIDELAACKRIHSLPEELAFVRKKGGVTVLGAQDIAQIRAIYGHETTQSMLQNIKTKIILHCGDPETARYFSDVIGEQRVERRKKTTTPATAVTERSRVTVSWEPDLDRLVNYSELQCLAPRYGYLRLHDGVVFPIHVGLSGAKPRNTPFVDL